MKCLSCGKQNDYRARLRTNRRCEGCGARFVFEPRSGDPLPDLAFKNAIDAVSDHGRLAWLERQLYYEVARRVRRRRFFHILTRRAQVSIGPAPFEVLLGRWIDVYGQPAGRLDAHAFATDPRAGDRAVDTTEYTFERLVVCGSDDIADFLLANDFHGDHRCAVLAASGYPQWARELLMPRFHETPPQTVVVVHDADRPGCTLAAEVARWFDRVQVVDAGLRPAHARRLRGLYLAGSPLRATGEGIAPEEARWLAKNSLELAALRPRALLRTLAGTVARREQQLETGDAPPSDAPFVIWGGDGGGDHGGDGGDGGDGDGGVG